MNLFYVQYYPDHIDRLIQSKTTILCNRVINNFPFQVCIAIDKHYKGSIPERMYEKISWKSHYAGDPQFWLSQELFQYLYYLSEIDNDTMFIKNGNVVINCPPTFDQENVYSSFKISEEIKTDNEILNYSDIFALYDFSVFYCPNKILTNLYDIINSICRTTNRYIDQNYINEIISCFMHKNKIKINDSIEIKKINLEMVNDFYSLA